LIEKLKERQQEMADSMTEAVEVVKDAATGSGGFDSKSPSRWAMSVGQDVIQGLVDGIVYMTPILESVAARIVSLFQSVTNAAVKSADTTIGKTIEMTKKLSPEIDAFIIRLALLEAAWRKIAFVVAKAAADSQAFFDTGPGGAGGGGKTPPKRAAGGSVRRGGIYEVAEPETSGFEMLRAGNGRNYLIAGKDGYIDPVKAALSGASTSNRNINYSSSPNIYINAPGGDPEVVKKATVDGLNEHHDEVTRTLFLKGR